MERRISACKKRRMESKEKRRKHSSSVSAGVSHASRDSADSCGELGVGLKAPRDQGNTEEKP